jgi:cyclic pyranopterin phosphate synthase
MCSDVEATVSPRLEAMEQIQHPVAPLIDGHNRTVKDLRISITDRCNFRCSYCMPEEGMKWLERPELLSFEEIERVVRVLVQRYDFESVRLTGGEPTVRAQLPLLVEKLSQIKRPSGKQLDISLTTNGATLRLMARELKAAGLTRINVSLDTLSRERFIDLTKRDQLTNVLSGVEAAACAGLVPLKINTVVMRGVNDDELVDLVAFAKQHGATPRFIEFMPLDGDKTWDLDMVVPAREIIDKITSVYPAHLVSSGSDPARRFIFDDQSGEFGVIASVTMPFCDACDRMRLTADGKLRNCLFAIEEQDLRGLLRSGASDDEIARVVEHSAESKWAGHQIGNVNFIRPKRSMSQIGG